MRFTPKSQIPSEIEILGYLSVHFKFNPFILLLTLNRNWHSNVRWYHNQRVFDFFYENFGSREVWSGKQKKTVNSMVNCFLLQWNCNFFLVPILFWFGSESKRSIKIINSFKIRKKKFKEIKYYKFTIYWFFLKHLILSFPVNIDIRDTSSKTLAPKFGAEKDKLLKFKLSWSSVGSHLFRTKPESTLIGTIFFPC